MYDQYKRKIEYLRVSITDRCNLRCQYCRPEVTQHVAHADILRYEEILRICQAAAALGITKFKVTGGEPLLRKDCAAFIAQLKRLSGVQQVTLTTNGSLLPQLLPALQAAGLDCVNISLDSTDSASYRQLTGGELSQALLALDALKELGLPFKINSVPLVGMGTSNILSLLKLADKYAAPLRFIELMPLACNSALQGVSGSAIRSLLAQLGLKVTRDSKTYGNGPAVYYRVQGYQMPLGFIEALHNKFCGSCNRVRLTSIGLLKPCLYSSEGLDLRQLLRSGISDAALQQAMERMIFAKPRGHSFEKSPAGFSMSQIGG